MHAHFITFFTLVSKQCAEKNLTHIRLKYRDGPPHLEIL